MVESLGYQPLPMTRLADILEHLQADDVSFVLLGFHLDDGEGLDALSEIRQLAPDLPIVMLTDNTWDTRMAEAMRRGAVTYLARPFGVDDLREILGRR
jgi:DNA-binding NtrC family response regulator